MSPETKRIGAGAPGRPVSVAEAHAIVTEALDSLGLEGRRLLVIVPDGTRTMPMPLMFELIARAAGPRVGALDYLVALGTHQPMSDEQLSRLVGRPVVCGRAGGSRIINHRWDDPSTFVTLGVIPASEIRDLSGGAMSRDVTVSLNRLVVEYDHALVCGPVFPHEVAGFSGGNKYFFPGVAGADIIDTFHWLGALITNRVWTAMGLDPATTLHDIRWGKQYGDDFVWVFEISGAAGLHSIPLIRSNPVLEGPCRIFIRTDS